MFHYREKKFSFKYRPWSVLFPQNSMISMREIFCVNLSASCKPFSVLSKACSVSCKACWTFRVRSERNVRVSCKSCEHSFQNFLFSTFQLKWLFFVDKIESSFIFILPPLLLFAIPDNLSTNFIYISLIINNNISNFIFEFENIFIL